MQKPFTTRTSSKLSLALTLWLLVLGVPNALAGKDDFKQPVLIDSEKQNIDLKSSTTIFDKNVSVIQGSLSIKADKLLAQRQNLKGKEVYIATGNPAIYQQTLDDGKPIIASANEIKYDVETKTLVLKGNALLKQSNSQVAGERIRYDLINQTLEAVGKDGQRVQSIFNNEDEDGAQPPAEGNQ